MLIDHIGITVSDLKISEPFYTASLAPLGIIKIIEIHGWIGLGKATDTEKAEFWFGEDGTAKATQPPIHIAFSADSREDVDAFHAAAIAAGGKCNGKPGLREIYHPNYYGAFIIDPDGHNIEAVCHHNINN